MTLEQFKELEKAIEGKSLGTGNLYYWNGARKLEPCCAIGHWLQYKIDNGTVNIETAFMVPPQVKLGISDHEIAEIFSANDKCPNKYHRNGAVLAVAKGLIDFVPDTDL